jgi:hypothetical protein
MNLDAIVQSALPLITLFGLKLLGAIALWIVGRRLIGLAVTLVVRGLRLPFDQTVAGYIGHNDHYWQVYFDTNRIIREAFGEAGFPAPAQHVLVHQG